MSILKAKLESWFMLSVVLNFKISSLLISNVQTVLNTIRLIHLNFSFYGLLLFKFRKLMRYVDMMA